MSKMIYALILVFAVTLAITIGLRMGPEAMTVAIGVVFGVALGLSVSLLIASFARHDEPAPPRATIVRSSPRERVSTPQMPQQPQSPVIIVNPASATPPGWPPYSPTMLPGIPPPQATHRRGARVVGEEAEEEKDG